MTKNDLLQQLDYRRFYSHFISTLNGNGKSNVICPFHEDKNPSLSINLETGLWNCFAGCGRGNAIDFYIKLKGIEFKAAIEEIAGLFGLNDLKATKKITRSNTPYNYTDKDGNVIYRKVRLDYQDGTKNFYIEHQDKNGIWIKGRGVDIPLLYRLPEVIQSDIVYFVEGEKCVEIIRMLGLVGTTLDSGSNSKWDPTYEEYLKNKTIFIFPDNDQPGRDYARRIAENLNGKIKSLKIVTLPGLNEKEDIVDWTNERDSDESILRELTQLTENTLEWIPEKANTDLWNQLLTWDDVLDSNENIEWAIEKIIPIGGITVLFGKGGIGKTWLSLDMGKCISMGIPFLGYKTKQLPVIYCDFENPLSVVKDRLMKLQSDDPSCKPEKEMFRIWHIHQTESKPPKLDSKEWENYKKLPPGVLIIDTLRASNNQDENDSRDIQIIIERIKELRELGFTIIILHHTPKSSDITPKGSTAISDLADHILGLNPVKKTPDGKDTPLDDDDIDEDVVYRLGVRGKTRYGEVNPIYLHLDTDKGFILAPDPQDCLLRSMYEILLKDFPIPKTKFIENCKQSLVKGRDKIRNLVDKGKGKYWRIEDDKTQKNIKLIIPIDQTASSLPIYTPQTSKLDNNGETEKSPIQAEITECPENIEFSGFLIGV